MAITADDLRFFASEVMDDSDTGGGPITGTAVQDGADNNVFPDVMPSDRASGRLQLRRVHVAVMSDGPDLLAQAQVSMFERPSDAAVECCIFAGPERRAAAQELLQASAVSSMADGMPRYYVARGNYSYIAWPLPGERIFSAAPELGEPIFLVQERKFGFVESVTPSGPDFAVELSGVSAPVTNGTFNAYSLAPRRMSNAANACGLALTTASASIGATSIQVDRTSAQVVPFGGAYPDAANGIDPTPLEADGGLVPIFREGDPVVIRSGPTREVRVVQRVYGGRLTLTTGLANAYPSGSTVSALVTLGDMQAKAPLRFSQQTWTRSWSDTVIGNSITAQYSGAIGLSNIGCETDRYAVVFTSATDFEFYSERRGKLANGTTAAEFSPLNPNTNQPLFTLSPGGWGGGWMRGSVLRINTVGARGSLWGARCTSPSAPGGSDGVTLQIRGGVDA